MSADRRPPGTPPVSATETALSFGAPKSRSAASTQETQFVPPPALARNEASFDNAEVPLVRGPAQGSPSSLGEVPHAAEPAQGRVTRWPLRLAWLGLAVTTAVIVTAASVRNPKTVQALLEESEGALAPTASTARPSPVVPTAPSASASAAPRPPLTENAPTAELDAARLAGTSALGALAQKYPNDIAVQRALLLAHAGDRAGYGTALSAAKRIFELDPNATLDDDMRKSLIRIANGPIDVASLALEAFASKLGQLGPDLLYEVTVDPGMGRFPRERAAKLLDSADVKKIASPALLIAVELKTSNPCKRKDLFARAAREGDARALNYLKPLTTTAGCTKLFVVKKDCFECLGNRAALNGAIKAIEERLSSR